MATPIPENRARINATDAASVTGGALVQTGAGDVAVGIFSDSRAVVPGCAFVALRGERFDGHAFVDAAVASGASLVVVERGRGGKKAGAAAVVEVDDTLVAWGALARAHLQRWRRARVDASPRLVAITGSTGKTTTKTLCAALLAEVGATHSTAGNLNNRIGVPAVLFGLEPRHAFAVVEVGMSLRGEIATLGEILEPDVAVITNVGIAHAEGVGGTRDDVAREKGALFASLPEDGVSVVNHDDDRTEEALLRSSSDRSVTFGKALAADYRLAVRTVTVASGACLTVQRRWEQLEVAFPLVGEGAAIDFVAALAAAEAAAGRALSLEEIDRALRVQVPAPGRAALLTLGDGTLVLDDTYNANPASMASALASLQEIAAVTKRRSVAVLGEMKELGPLAHEAHAELGLLLVRTGVALAVGCGGLIDEALDRAAAAGTAVIKARNVDEAAALVTAQLLPGDVVLVKGSRGVRTERVIDALRAARGSAP